MEKFSQIKTVGDVSESDKRQVEEEYRSKLNEGHMAEFSPEYREEIEKDEMPKNEKQLLLIDLANKETNALLEKFGIESYDIPEKNIHMISSDLIEKIHGEKISAISLMPNRLILLDKNFYNSPILFAAASFHEMLHLKSYFSLQLEKNQETGEIRKAIRRVGMGVSASLKKIDENYDHDHFRGLSEAITAHTEKQFLKKAMFLPILDDERKSLESKENTDVIDNRLPASVDKDDVYWIDNETKEYFNVGYRKHREVLNYLCEEISKDNDLSMEDVHEKFLKAQLAGSLIELAKIIEKSFGAGSFRDLSNMNKNERMAINVLEILKKDRLRVLSEKRMYN